MKAAEFRVTIDELYARLVKLTATKGEEYKRAEDNQFANFERGAAALGMTREQVLWVYASKHLDSIITYIKDAAEGREREYAEPITGRIDDVILYMLLLRGMVAKPTQADICKAFAVEVTALQDREPRYVEIATNVCLCDGSGLFPTPTSGLVRCPAETHHRRDSYYGSAPPPEPAREAREAAPSYVHARVPRVSGATAAPEVTEEAIEAINVLRKRAMEMNPFVDQSDADIMFPMPGKHDWIENPCNCGSIACRYNPQSMEILRKTRDEVLMPPPVATFLRSRTGGEVARSFPDINFREQPQGAVVSSLDGLQAIVFQWAEKQFGPGRDKAAWMKFFEELGEVIKNPEDELEWADLQILLLDLAEIHKINLTRAIHRKLDINRNRLWTEKNGVMVHVTAPHVQVNHAHEP